MVIKMKKRKRRLQKNIFLMSLLFTLSLSGCGKEEEYDAYMFWRWWKKGSGTRQNHILFLQIALASWILHSRQYRTGRRHQRGLTLC